MLSRALCVGIGFCSALVCAVTTVLAAAAPLKVVATIFPLADLVHQIGKEHVEVVTLLPSGASPHTFEPTPSQVRDLAHAEVFVCVGAGLDGWAAKLLAARAGGKVTVVTVTDGVQLLGNTDGAGGDPHVWLDPVLVRDHMVTALVDGLKEADPADAAAFDRGAAALRAALSDLDDEIRRTLEPMANRNYVAFHSAWRYFGERYGLHEVAAVEPFPGKEPSAQEIAAIIDKARASRTGIIVIEPQFNPRVAQQVAREFGARVLLLDPLGGSRVPGRDTYMNLLRYNAQAFAKGPR